MSNATTAPITDTLPIDETGVEATPVVCTRCGSIRIAEIFAKCSDCFSVSVGDSYQEGYVPDDLGFYNCYGDGVAIDYCLDCGQMLGDWPVAETEVERLSRT